MDNTETKNKILAAAKELFAKKGFDGTSTREIVNSAGVNISLIAYHFGGKENLFFSMFDHFMEDTYHTETNITPSAILDEFKSIIKYIISLRFEDPQLVKILHHEIILNSSRCDKIKDSLTPIWNRMKLLLLEGKSNELFKFENIDNALSFTMSVAIFPRQNQYFIESTNSNTNHLNIDTTINELVNFILKGLSVN
ncbi:TetR family transcriptional regulator [Clostridium intestinale]|uniref:Transcriptional regulator, TetR family n=1 Tax=Clostridium intestinale DSM 6191 TaxID=1121320 RepID=A0A1M6EQ75_9CLOT|nr:TetR family transcriptional regulator [Clostridium intestinale]SHI87615.1 transcriptional regulator, TetR family [Clostridium intestinale DSM 6191]